MDLPDVSELWGFAVVIAIVIAIAFVIRKAGRAASGKMQEKVEAMFRASFPELQPHFHPARVYEFAKARQKRKATTGSMSWKNPPGFPAAASAEVQPDGLRDKVRLLDASGALLADFVFEEHPEGGVLRVGKGKFTANLKGPEPRVRYWHPDREFKWTPRSWKFQTRVADEPLQSDSDRSSSSDDYSSSSSSSSAARAAAAGAGIVAAGGTFDGGGASAAWDDSGGGGSSSSGGDSSPDFSSVESGSSSSSTSY